jgi:hypothetical protein
VVVRPRIIEVQDAIKVNNSVKKRASPLQPLQLAESGNIVQSNLNSSVTATSKSPLPLPGSTPVHVKLIKLRAELHST